MFALSLTAETIGLGVAPTLGTLCLRVVRIGACYPTGVREEVR
jgi:hypothetical protein